MTVFQEYLADGGSMPEIKQLVYELIVRVSSDLSDDIEAAIRGAYDTEAEGTSARNVMKAIIENIDLARAKRTPLCQDTGLLNFYIAAPDGTDQEKLKSEIIGVVREATKDGILRPNAVNPITGKNSSDNTGYGLPYFSFERSEGKKITIDLMLKGGGSENVGAQYRLPDTALKAGRDIKGVEKCVIDAVYKAQGFGCAPGVI
ncbi:MAG: fumarate hydratase, partial [Deltaproteobacteria bacterium]|nr:fumarate hydratase [Deltaproteobacteria bacterium]